MYGQLLRDLSAVSYYQCACFHWVTNRRYKPSSESQIIAAHNQARGTSKKETCTRELMIYVECARTQRNAIAYYVCLLCQY